VFKGDESSAATVSKNVSKGVGKELGGVVLDSLAKLGIFSPENAPKATDSDLRLQTNYQRRKNIDDSVPAVCAEVFGYSRLKLLSPLKGLGILGFEPSPDTGHRGALGSAGGGN